MNATTHSTHQSPERNSPPSTPSSDLPSPFHILVVCSGNICRSPMGEHVFRKAVADAGLTDAVVVSSAGTGDWHVGQGADEPAQRILAEAGYPTDHVVRHVNADMVDSADLILAADRGHVRFLRSLAAAPDKVRLLREFDPDADGDEVPDPYGYHDDEFRNVLAMLEAAAPGIIAAVRSELPSRS